MICKKSTLAADIGIAISDGAEIAREIADITVGADNLNELITLRKRQADEHAGDRNVAAFHRYLLDVSFFILYNITKVT